MSDEKKVVVTKFDMPFGEMVNFLCRFWLAWLLSTLLIGVALSFPIFAILTFIDSMQR